MQFTSAVFSGNETFGSVDIWVILTGVLEDPTSVRYVDYIFVSIANNQIIFMKKFLSSIWCILQYIFLCIYRMSN